MASIVFSTVAVLVSINSVFSIDLLINRDDADVFIYTCGVLSLNILLPNYFLAGIGSASFLIIQILLYCLF